MFTIINKIKLLSFSICTIGTAMAQNYTGKFSSEGDVSAKGIMTMELTQTKSKLEGIANYKKNDGSSDSGILSVNGYVKNGIAYIRFRDQKGNTVSDGDIHFQGDKTLHFSQSTSNYTFVPKSAFLYKTGGIANSSQAGDESNSKYFSGKYSNEGDVTAKGILSFDMTQNGAKLEGTATFTTFDGSIQSGVLSVNGYTKDGIGYIRFRDQKGNIIADGTLKKSNTNTLFTQTTSSDWIPKSAVLYR